MSKFETAVSLATSSITNIEPVRFRVTNFGTKNASSLVMKKWIIYIGLGLTSFSSAAESVKIKTDAGSLKLRSGASMGSKACGLIRSGETVEKIGEQGPWFQIKINKRGCPKSAWIHGYYTSNHYKGARSAENLKNWSPQSSAEESQASGVVLGEEGLAEAFAEYQSGLSTQSTPASTGDSELGDSAPSYIPIPTSRPSSAGEVVSRPDGISSADAALCEFHDSSKKATDPVRTKNCYELIKKANAGQIPKAALVYSLKYLKENMNGLKDSRCLAKGGPKGIKNGCQFVMNDLNKRVKNFPHRSPSYFIDLCHGSSGSANKGLVYTTYINRGTGSGNNSYADQGRRRTTVPGAFLTGALTPFVPYRVTKAYRDIGWARCFQKDSRGRVLTNRPIKDMSKCPVTRLALYGAQNSNNSTSANKPMHVSPYKSSWGCPSIKADERWIMDVLNKKGPSLVMNYGPQKYHKDSSINNCKND